MANQPALYEDFQAIGSAIKEAMVLQKISIDVLLQKMGFPDQETAQKYINGIFEGQLLPDTGRTSSLTGMQNHHLSGKALYNLNIPRNSRIAESVESLIPGFSYNPEMFQMLEYFVTRASEIYASSGK
ncbi:hypothetical protein GF323_00715 [Candidatus Woesearchaeota archaeon]|nr:hypothetical protein [Candidatus Woesearchaeota archaeon]